MLDPLTFIAIEMEALKFAEDPDEDDYKDAIVEYFADEKHLTDEDLDKLFQDFLDTRAHHIRLFGRGMGLRRAT